MFRFIRDFSISSSKKMNLKKNHSGFGLTPMWTNSFSFECHTQLPCCTLYFLDLIPFKDFCLII